MDHISVVSSNVLSAGYDKLAKKLEVKFKSGGTTTYSNVPEHVYLSFLQAPSKGKFVNNHLAYRYEDQGGPSVPACPPSPDPDLSGIIAKSWARIASHLPIQAHDFVQSLIKENPAKVIPVKVRVTKQGDFRGRCCEAVARITVNKSGNPYQFLITLIHEIAHARAYRDYGSSIKPHGREWEVTFSALLHRSLAANCFPNDLVAVVRHQAFYPQISSTRALMLQKALRPHDTLDFRPLVEELPAQTCFSLRRGVVLQKGRACRHYFLCTDEAGKIFRVPASLRVTAVYRKSNGSLELVTDYEEEAKNMIEVALWNDTYADKYETSRE